MPRKKTYHSNNRDEKNIPLDWLDQMDPEGNAATEQAWRNSRYILDKLKLIIERKMEPLMLDRDVDYANPNWGYLRADKNGRLRTLEEIYKLLP